MSGEGTTASAAAAAATDGNRRGHGENNRKKRNPGSGQQRAGGNSQDPANPPPNSGPKDPKTKRKPKDDGEVRSRYNKLLSEAIRRTENELCMPRGEPRDECPLCCQKTDFFGMGECRHAICLECVVRMRVAGRQPGLNDIELRRLQRQCPHCRQETHFMYVFLNPSRAASLDTSKFLPTGAPGEVSLNMLFESKAAAQRFEALTAHVCRECKSDPGTGDFPAFLTFGALKQHLSVRHGRTFCHYCTDNLSQLTRERATYTPEMLQLHLNAASGGHPKCFFCPQRFFDLDARFRHLRRDHFFCQFCEVADQQRGNIFYKSHDQLVRHYRAAHFLCAESQCQQMGIAFATALELSVHTSAEHASSRQGATFSLDFRFNDRAFGRRIGAASSAIGGTSSGTSGATPVNPPSQAEIAAAQATANARAAQAAATRTAQQQQQQQSADVVIPSVAHLGGPIVRPRDRTEAFSTTNYPPLANAAPSSSTAAAPLQPTDFPRLPKKPAPAPQKQSTSADAQQQPKTKNAKQRNKPAYAPWSSDEDAPPADAARNSRPSTTQPRVAMWSAREAAASAASTAAKKQPEGRPRNDQDDDAEAFPSLPAPQRSLALGSQAGTGAWATAGVAKRNARLAQPAAMLKNVGNSAPATKRQSATAPVRREVFSASTNVAARQQTATDDPAREDEWCDVPVAVTKKKKKPQKIKKTAQELAEERKRRNLAALFGHDDDDDDEEQEQEQEQEQDEQEERPTSSTSAQPTRQQPASKARKPEPPRKKPEKDEEDWPELRQHEQEGPATSDGGDGGGILGALTSTFSSMLASLSFSGGNAESSSQPSPADEQANGGGKKRKPQIQMAPPPGFAPISAAQQRPPGL